MQPGEWEITRTVTGYNFAGITAQEYQEKLGGTTSVKTCITPETADRPDPSFLATNQQTGCDYDNLTATTGSFSATLTCQSDDGTKSEKRRFGKAYATTCNYREWAIHTN